MKNKPIIRSEELRENLNLLIMDSIREKFPYHYKAYEKVVTLEKLPKEIECKRLFRKLEKRYGKGAYAGIMVQNYYYQTVHDKLIEDLSRLIRYLNPTTAIEVCAGKGKLSYHLNQGGIKIVPTDIEGTEYVEKIDYLRAIRKYRPDLVISAWPAGYDSTFVNNVMRQDGVKHLIVIGKGGYLARKYWRSILKHSEIIPIELRSFPSVAASMVNADEHSREMEMATKKFFAVGRSMQVHQSILFRSKRNK